MREFRNLLVLVLALASAAPTLAQPFPDNKKNHWVYASMIQIKKDRLWYRVHDNIPKGKKLTRTDMAKKTLLLAVDSQALIAKFQQTTALVSEPAYDAKTKAWVKRFINSFAQKKLIYQNYLGRVTKLWNYFLPDIKPIAKKLKVDTTVVSQNLKLEKITLDGLRVRGRRR